MNIFSDQHHLSLYNSLRLLFERRLDGNLYRPVGKEWLDKGYWKMAEIYNNAPETVEQYLGLREDYMPKDGSAPLNRLQKVEDGIHYIYDPEYDYFHKAITLEKFFSMPIDIVIASIPEHIESFTRLASEHPNKPKVIYQVGNSWSVKEGYAKNIMASAIIKDIPPETNLVTYHQEFDLDIFRPDPFEFPTIPQKRIYCFINCFSTAQHYQNDWVTFVQAESYMPEWEFRSYGGQCRDGAAHGAVELASKMREARFIWHTKKGGDGFGHIIHNAMAVGRPVITHISDYKDKLAGRLLVDGETCFDLDNHSLDDVLGQISNMTFKKYEWMCQQCYLKFKEVVDFDREELEIRKFLERLS